MGQFAGVFANFVVKKYQKSEEKEKELHDYQFLFDCIRHLRVLGVLVPLRWCVLKHGRFLLHVQEESLCWKNEETGKSEPRHHDSNDVLQ